jgi:3-methyladenine DNA glycosylase AlkC
MPAVKKPAVPFKNWFDAALYRQIADALGAAEPKFDRKQFLALTLDGLGGRELMDRVRQTAVAAEAALPGSYRDKLAVLRRIAPRIKHGFVNVSFCHFVAQHGLDDFEHSLDALKFLTAFGSAEFAVRPFIQRDPARALAILQTWANDKDEHVRRLASEGSRPRLPWGARLGAIVADPELTAPILEALKADPSLYVRKSVANHLNDIAKDHPDWVLDRVEAWNRTHAGTAWIVRHALRTLVKKGHPRALIFFGVDSAAAKHVAVRRFTVAPARINLGGSVLLMAELSSKTNKELPLVIDYVVHYAKASGATSAKVFKWTVARLLPRQSLTLTKRQTIRDFTTRKHHAGRHRVELQVNGQRIAETSFQLILKH